MITYSSESGICSGSKSLTMFGAAKCKNLTVSRLKVAETGHPTLTFMNTTLSEVEEGEHLSISIRVELPWTPLADKMAKEAGNTMWDIPWRCTNTTQLHVIPSSSTPNSHQGINISTYSCCGNSQFYPRTLLALRELSWTYLVDKMTKNAGKRLGLLKRDSPYLNPNQRALIYKSMVRYKVEYVSYVWKAASETS